jgi:hypothetical protein
MTTHLKIHKELWHEYQAIKIEIDTKECEEKIHRTKEIEEKVHRTKEIEESFLLAKNQVSGFVARGKNRGPIWDYFIEDLTDNSFVNCIVCSAKLSRGPTGQSTARMNSSGMINHLRIHSYVWEKYIEQKKEFKRTSKKRISFAKNKEGPNIYEPEGSAWQYF